MFIKDAKLKYFLCVYFWPSVCSIVRTLLLGNTALSLLISFAHLRSFRFSQTLSAMANCKLHVSLDFYICNLGFGLATQEHSGTYSADIPEFSGSVRSVLAMLKTEFLLESKLMKLSVFLRTF